MIKNAIFLITKKSSRLIVELTAAALLMLIHSNAIAGASDGNEVFDQYIKDQKTPSFFEESLLMDCEKTPLINHDYITPKPAKKSNNLLRKSGSSLRAKGKYIQIQGKIVDEDCVPIPNAVIKIWQQDNAGNFENFYDLKSEWDVINENYDPNFSYSGTVMSNNLGLFSFLTIFPNKKEENKAPHINILAKHPEFGEISTMMFFNKNPHNKSDVEFNKIAKKDQHLITAYGRKLDKNGNFEGRVYSFLITMQGINRYKRY